MNWNVELCWPWNAGDGDWRLQNNSVVSDKESPSLLSQGQLGGSNLALFACENQHWREAQATVQVISNMSSLVSMWMNILGQSFIILFICFTISFYCLKININAITWGQLFSYSEDLIEDDEASHWQLTTPNPQMDITYLNRKRSVRTDASKESIQHIQEVNSMFFFQPVVDGRTSSYTTFLGEQIHFDLLAQPYKLRSAEFDCEANRFLCITANTEGEPMTCSLADVSFDTLSEALYVWHGADVSYQISTFMCSGCIRSTWVAVTFTQRQYTLFSFCIQKA